MIRRGDLVKDALVVILLSASLATAVTAHLATVYGLLHRAPRWRALVALVVPIAAPFWARKEGMHVRASAFVLGTVGYVSLRLLASQ